LLTDSSVKTVGFIELDEFTGCSPDGLINDDGMIEIKCKDNHTYLRQLINKEDEIETKYKIQIQFNLYVTNRKWCDYVCYNPNFSNAIFILRIERDESVIEKIKETLKVRIEEVKKIIDIEKEMRNIEKI
jgi:exodeoxyribonuclease (lambda-induced)